ncbi:hypothetical protein BD413DRAFT_556098 [Trametes elegans]|nr:hypothetical protein BD413DRAFT_556098 [Trametes elegans]
MVAMLRRLHLQSFLLLVVHLLAAESSGRQQSRVFTTSDNIQGSTENTLGGETFVVVLDTGFSGLFINTSGRYLKYTNATQVVAQVYNGRWYATGTINFAELRVEKHVVPFQAFLDIVEEHHRPQAGCDGVLGVRAVDDEGTTVSIYRALADAWGKQAAEALARSPVANVLSSSGTSAPSFLIVHRTSSASPDSTAGTAPPMSTNVVVFAVRDALLLLSVDDPKADESDGSSSSVAKYALLAVGLLVATVSVTMTFLGVALVMFVSGLRKPRPADVQYFGVVGQYGTELYCGVDVEEGGLTPGE